MRKTRRTAVVLTTVVLSLGGSSALATWIDTASASMSISSGSLVAATGLSATPGCLLVVPRVTLSWTATTSVQATGYAVFRKTGAGGYSQIATVSGQAANTYLDTTVAIATTYTYYVQAYVGSWTADSSAAAASTAAVCL